jgi:gamma-glutamylputrescine oxidase
MTTSGYIDTYYARTLPPDTRAHPTLNADLITDVCVIGGGLAGLNTALGLLERGQSCVIVESKRIGWGGSGRNGGFVAKGYSASEMTLLKKLGLQDARGFVNLTKMARQKIRARIDEHKIDCGPVKNGVLTVSWKDDAAAVQNYIRDVNAAFHVGFEFYPREKVRDLCRTEKYFDGVFSPQDFQFMPLRYVHGLARVIESKDGKIFENTPAVKIEKSGDKWRVITAGGSVTAQHVVLCCSIYVDDLNKKLAKACFPVRTFVMATKPMPRDILRSAINNDYAIYDNRFCSDYYRAVDDGTRILWGGRVALTDQPDIGEKLLGDMIKVYPQLKGHAGVDVAWSGELCYAPHKMPQIGQIEPGYWYNTGYGGHGLAPTTVGGELVAAAIVSNDRAYEMFRPIGLSYAGGRAGRYVAQLVYFWWRARDHLSV